MIHSPPKLPWRSWLQGLNSPRSGNQRVLPKSSWDVYVSGADRHLRWWRMAQFQKNRPEEIRDERDEAVSV